MNEISATTQFPVTQLIDLQAKPPLFSPGEPLFWTDPHIAKHMLKFHLDPDTEAASRKPEVIQRSVEWIVNSLGLKPGDSLIDLGCGPGLYTTRLAKFGMHVTGVDFSQNSIEYAVNVAQERGLEISYRCQDYLQLADQSEYDAAMLIYGDYCALSPERRARLLANIHRALKPGGKFVLDVTTPSLRRRLGLKNGWYAASSGFWKPGPHLVLEQGFAYEGDIYLDQYIVLEENAKISVYRNWYQDYTAETIRAELESNRFTVHSIWSDLTGQSYQAETDWIGIIVER